MMVVIREIIPKMVNTSGVYDGLRIISMLARQLLIVYPFKLIISPMVPHDTPVGSFPFF